MDRMDDAGLCMMTNVSGSASLSCNKRKNAMISSSTLPSSTIPSSSLPSNSQKNETQSNNSIKPDLIRSKSWPLPIVTPAHMTSSVNSNSVTYQNIRILKLSSEKYSMTAQPIVSPCIPFVNNVPSSTANYLPVAPKPSLAPNINITPTRPIRPYSKRSFRRQTMPSQKLPALEETVDEDVEENSEVVEKETSHALPQSVTPEPILVSSTSTNSNINISTNRGNKPIVRYKIYMINDTSNQLISSSLEKQHVQITNNTRMYQNISTSVPMQNQAETRYAQSSNYIDEDLVRLHINLKKVLYKH